MRRREFIGLVGGAAARPLVAARTQQSAIPVIGDLTEVPDVARAPCAMAFPAGMAESGYVEGKNFAVEYRANPESLRRCLKLQPIWFAVM